MLATPLAAQPVTGVAGGDGVKAAKKNCTCRFQGQRYQLGVMMCLKTPDGPRMARCSLNLNNTSWKMTSTPCNMVFNGQRQSLWRLAGNLDFGAITKDTPH